MNETKVNAYQCPSCGHPVPVGSPMCPGCHRIFRQEELGSYTVELERNKTVKELDSRDRKSKRNGLVVCFVILAAVFGLVFYMSHQESVKKEAMEARMNECYQQVQTAILNEDYDLALLTVQNLRADKTLSKEQAEKWDQIREDTIKLIQEKQKNN